MVTTPRWLRDRKERLSAGGRGTAPDWLQRRQERVGGMTSAGQQQQGTQSYLPPEIQMKIQQAQSQQMQTPQIQQLAQKQKPEGGFLDSLLHSASLGFAGEPGNLPGTIVGSLLPVGLAAMTGGAALAPMGKILAGRAGLAGAAGAAAKLASAKGAKGMAARAAAPLGQKALGSALRGGTTSAIYNLAHMGAAKTRGEEIDPSSLARGVGLSAGIGAALPAAGHMFKAFRNRGVAPELLDDLIRTGEASASRGLPQAGIESMIPKTVTGRAATGLKGLLPQTQTSDARRAIFPTVGRAASKQARTFSTRQGADVLRRKGLEGADASSRKGLLGGGDQQQLYESGKRVRANMRKFSPYRSPSEQAATFMRNKVPRDAKGVAVEHYRNLQGTGYSVGKSSSSMAKEVAKQYEQEFIDPELAFSSTKNLPKDSFEHQFFQTLNQHNQYFVSQTAKQMTSDKLYSEMGSTEALLTRHLGSASTAFRSLGPAGRRADSLLRHTEEFGRKLLHETRTRINPQRIAPGSTQQDLDQVFRAMNQTYHKDVVYNTLTKTQKKLYTGIRESFDDMGRLAQERQLYVNTGSGYQPFRMIRNYYPRVHDKEFIALADDFLNTQDPNSTVASVVSKIKDPRLKRAIQELAKSRGTNSIAQVQKDLRSVTREYLKTNPSMNKSFLHSRQIGELPTEFYVTDPGVLAKYTKDWSTAMAVNEIAGVPGDPMYKIAQALKPIQSQDPGLYKQAISFTNHLLGTEPMRISEFGSSIMALNTFRLMGLATISNVSQSVNTAARTNFKTVYRAIRDQLKLGSDSDMLRALKTMGSFADPKAQDSYYRAMYNTGQLPTSWFNKLTTGLANKLMKGLKFDSVESFNQRTAAWAGYKYWSKELADDLLAGRNVSKVSRLLTDMGLDPKAIIRRGKMLDEEAMKVGSYLLRETQFPKAYMDIPLFTQKETGKLFFQFSRFMYRQGGFIKRHILDEGKRYLDTGGKEGSITPFLSYATTGAGAGFVIGNIRDVISGRERPEGMLDTYLDALSWVGAMGMFGNLVRSLETGPAHGMVQLGGPSAGLALEAFSGLQGLYQTGKSAGQYAATGDYEAIDNLMSGLRTTGKSALSVGAPSALAAPLSRGQAPFGVEIPALQRIIAPDEYDPTGRKEAGQEYTAVIDELDDSIIDLVTRGNDEKLMKVISDAAEEGVMIDQNVIQRRMETPNVRLNILRSMLQQTQDQQMRDMIKQQIELLEQSMEISRAQQVPSPARGMVDFTPLFRQ